MGAFEFRQLFGMLASATDEYTKIPAVFEQSVLPRLAKTGAMLDIGSGPGFITLPLLPHFDHINVVEPDPVFCEEVVRKALPSGKLVTAFNGTWDAARLGEQRFDLIINAHVLYFVAPEQWDSFIQKMVAHVAPGGRLAVLLVAKGDEVTNLIRRTLDTEEPGSYPFSAGVIEHLRTHNYTYEVVPFEASISAETADKLLDIMALFPIMQYDRSSTKEQRLALIERHFKESGTYRMPYTVDVVMAEAAG